MENERLYAKTPKKYPFFSGKWKNAKSKYKAKQAKKHGEKVFLKGKTKRQKPPKDYTKRKNKKTVSE